MSHLQYLLDGGKSSDAKYTQLRAQHNGATTGTGTGGSTTTRIRQVNTFADLKSVLPAYEELSFTEILREISKQGVTINRPPRDGKLAFIKSPDGISIELLQMGEQLPPAEPWTSMQNTGTW